MRAGCCVVAALLSAVLAPQGAGTRPLDAARTGLACGSCHFDPDGGGPRNERGSRFARHRHLIAGDSSGQSAAAVGPDREGRRASIMVGADQRIALVASHLVGDEQGRIAFVSAPTAIHITFQPHSRLVLLYTLESHWDWEASSFELQGTRALGQISGLPWNAYLKAGRLFVPFGLRIDDPQVATRSGIGYWYVGGSMLPFEPQQPDMGIEIGAESGLLFCRAAFTNGFSDVLAYGFAETKTVKVGYHGPRCQVALSLYDNLLKARTTPMVRYTYWSLYGLACRGPLAWIGELAIGTNSLRPAADPTGRRHTSLGGFAELNWAFAPRYNARVRYDRLERGRDQGQPARDMSTFDRYSLEGEWEPFPMARLRLAGRYTDPKYSDFPPDVREALIELQLSY